MLNKESIFQVDSDIIKNCYRTNPNYKIEVDQSIKIKHCVLYFSSNNIYFPNTEATFISQIIKKNKFEWYQTRIINASKHIFLRDIKKQWYLTGINSSLNNPELLLKFLKKETKGYQVSAIGSSSGGYSAVLYGQQLNAKSIYTFNGQFEINSLLKKSNFQTDPIVFANQQNKNLRPYYDIKTKIISPNTIYYFKSNRSDWDVEQNDHIKDLKLKTFGFNTNHHGIPFIKSSLSDLLNYEVKALDTMSVKNINPILFSFRISGFIKTLKGIWTIISNQLKF